MKKDSGKIKKNCGDKFTDHSDKIRIMKEDTQESKNRIFAIELNYGHILEEITTIKGDVKEIKTAADKNALMTAKIYDWMAERKQGGKRK